MSVVKILTVMLVIGKRLTNKPVGLKMVVGSAAEVGALCREIRRRGDGPDFIAVDGNEGGSGAAPLALVD